jgi:hypothetical protein
MDVGWEAGSGGGSGSEGGDSGDEQQQLAAGERWLVGAGGQQDGNDGDSDDDDDAEQGGGEDDGPATEAATEEALKVAAPTLQATGRAFLKKLTPAELCFVFACKVRGGRMLECPSPWAGAPHTWRRCPLPLPPSHPLAPTPASPAGRLSGAAG